MTPRLAAPAPSFLRTVCAWCGVVLREGPAMFPTSHGCCISCANQLLGSSHLPAIEEAARAGAAPR